MLSVILNKDHGGGDDPQGGGGGSLIPPLPTAHNFMPVKQIKRKRSPSLGMGSHIPAWKQRKMLEEAQRLENFPEMMLGLRDVYP